ncbi:MAG: nuclear transport factor 2 family protein [Opitutus sp.]|nr:nuclear transport factor 2 family protein [Opitutus sp.]
MKSTLLRLFALVAFFAVAARAADDKLIAAVRAADDERVAATKSGDRARLEAIYSDGLHYAHSNGKIDTKASYVESLVKRTTVYEKYDYQTREFRPAGPGIVLMIGRVLIQSSGAGGTQKNDLNILAVWREEQGKWRFLAWQSCKNPPADAAKK